MTESHVLTLRRGSTVRFASLSVLALIPCYWHRHLEAGDIASHTYNAWLASSAASGKLPGLVTSLRFENVLADSMLLLLGKLVGWIVAERIVVSVAVLAFFWSSYYLCEVLAGRSPMRLVPLLLIACYGWTFEAGFLNFYFSIAAGLAALGVAVRHSGKQKTLLGALLLIAWLAHPLGALLAISLIIYALAASKIGERRSILLLIGVWAVCATVRALLRAHYAVEQPGSFFLLHNGADQAVLYRSIYKVVAAAMLLLGGISILHRLLKQAGWFAGLSFPLAVQLYFCMLLVTAYLPSSIKVSPDTAALSYIDARLTVATAILGVAALLTSEVPKMEALGATAIAIFYFALLYQDTGRLSRREDMAERLVATLPKQSRVIETLHSPAASRLDFIHLVERPCINRCFVFSNYEPASRQFRVVAQAANPFAALNTPEVSDMEKGQYVAPNTGGQLFQIFECAGDGELQVAPLITGETNGTVIRDRCAAPSQ